MNMNGKLPIYEFNLNKMCKHPSILIITKRGGGKTWLCRTLLNHFRDYPVGIIISHTERTDPFFQDFFPDSFIYNKYDPEIFKKIIFRQREIKKQSNARVARGLRPKDTRLFLLMDDCLSNSKEWSKDECLKEILFNGRHLDITYILTMQQPMAIAPDLRSNFDFIFLLSAESITDEKKLYLHYSSMFETFYEFKRVYNQLTENYGIMVLKKREAKGNDINARVFHFKTGKISPQMIGCKQLKRFHEKNYNKSWEDKLYDSKFNFSSFLRKTNKPSFAIEKVDERGKVKFD